MLPTRYFKWFDKAMAMAMGKGKGNDDERRGSFEEKKKATALSFS